MITKKNKILGILFVIFLGACSISPGMHMSVKNDWVDNSEYVFIESINKNIEIIDINDFKLDQAKSDTYKIGNGDELIITVWGLPDIFPIANISPDQNIRRVNSIGNIYFPYIGIVNASGKTQNELRDYMTNKLSDYFNNPQLDISIANFNSQKIYILGEVTKPSKLDITDIPLTLADALGEVKGINTMSGAPSQVFVIRNEVATQMQPKIFKANMSSPSAFIDAGNFILQDNDIVYVNTQGIARWNKVIAQFFPFSTFLNSVENLTD